MLDRPGVPKPHRFGTAAVCLSRARDLDSLAPHPSGYDWQKDVGCVLLIMLCLVVRYYPLRFIVVVPTRV